MSYVENQTATGSSSNPDRLRAALAQLTGRKSDSVLAAPSALACSGENLKARDVVRLTKDLGRTPSGSEGVILGRYTNDPENVIVSLSEGGVEVLPREALELVELGSASRVFGPGRDLDEARRA